MFDTRGNLCQTGIIEVAVSSLGETSAAVIMSAASVQETKRGGPRPGSGRPKITGERPWDVEGISRRTYDRRKSPSAYAPTYAATELRWFCIKLPPLTDEAVLNVDVAIRCMGFETFYPLLWVPPVAARRTETGRAIPATSERLIPLLPAYSLVRFDRADPSWRRLAAFGRIMGAAEWPTAIPDGDIAELRKGLAPNGCKYPDADPAPLEQIKRRWVTMMDGLAERAARQMETV